MAKKVVKSAVKTETKVPAKKTVSRSKPQLSSGDQIEKACQDALTKLQSMKIELPLQADIEWCLGSYRSDKNPSGLYEMGEKALQVFQASVAKNAKAVSKKLISDLEKALAKR